MKLIKWGESELKKSDIKSATYDAETLFMDSFKASREDLFLGNDVKLPVKRLDLFRHYIALRASRYPLQYILNKVEFLGHDFILEEGVFIPRPETEILVERSTEHIISKGKKKVNILEIGTGCGNIAISLTKSIPGCRIIASDISSKALKTAAKNAKMHGAIKRIRFVKSDLFDNISSIFYDYFDIIISNPPYVRKRDLVTLQPELSHEDRRALDGGAGGIRFYKQILKEGVKYLKREGSFAFEIGYDQADEVEGIIRKDGRFLGPEFYHDHCGHKRVTIIGRGPSQGRGKRVG
ncbi:MAG: peptide chain release factor N(5)-glutamine methyltransferase [Candidatus Omnitrophica bacterium]|nr:peptide chain release factor N(5)-glutamine methyltransferase [Candidatus Omnitrophota bacterium]